MLEFVQLLKQRYLTVLKDASHQSVGDETLRTIYQQRIDQLILAEAFIRKGQLIKLLSQPQLHIAVIGPTQAGKSSLVNVLLNSHVAGVSPLAGYTVHPQGFCHNKTLADCDLLQRYFGRFQQLTPEQLNKNRFDCFSLSENPHISPLLPTCVLWDTPDFDSIDSATYREGVIRTIALADILVLVLSKEKYADQSVWELMATLESLQQPTIICLNKLVADSEAILLRSLEEKWRQARTDDFPHVVAMYYQMPPALPTWPASDFDVLIRMSRHINGSKQGISEQALLKKYWQTWTEPVIAEHQSLQQWHALIEALIKQATDDYQRHYLNHPHYYETFQLALARLLNLLEIPGLARIVAGTRRVLTWPIKKINNLGKKRKTQIDGSYEVTLLNQLAEHALTHLSDRLFEQAEQDRQRSSWWRQLNHSLRKHRQECLQSFDHAVHNYHQNFQPAVEDAAHRLYRQLQTQPLLLNSLRATRASADATAIVLAFYMGGIGIYDLAIAPAMLTLTSLLAESAVGSYMYRIEAELKQQQLNTVKQSLFVDFLADQLMQLPQQLSSTAYFNISREQLRIAEQQMEKPNGLRLL